MNILRRHKYMAIFAFLAIVLAACSTAAPTPTPVAPTPTKMMSEGGDEGMGSAEERHDEPQALNEKAKEGYEIYRRVGCASCHGDQGEGGVGPALAGHTPEQVRRQVRNPVGNMPRFSQEQVSDQDLEKIIAFVESLGGASAAHNHGDQELTPIHVHHLMTLMALQNENVPDAIHHLEHAASLAADETQRQELATLLDLLKQGKVHDVEHKLQEILGNMEPEVGTTLGQLQAQLALDLLSEMDVAGARHAVEHMAEVATGDEQATAREVLDLLDKNDIAGAKAHLRELLGEGGQHNH